MDNPACYKIVRHYFSDRYPNRIVRRGLTLAEAQAHCGDPESSSKTATSRAGRQRTAARGPWFDGYDVDRPRRRTR